MGYKWQVEVWRKFYEGYGYESYWEGNSFIAAMLNLYKAKREFKKSCVTLHWR